MAVVLEVDPVLGLQTRGMLAAEIGICVRLVEKDVPDHGDAWAPAERLRSQLVHMERCSTAERCGVAVGTGEAVQTSRLCRSASTFPGIIRGHLLKGRMGQELTSPESVLVSELATIERVIDFVAARRLCLSKMSYVLPSLMFGLLWIRFAAMISVLVLLFSSVRSCLRSCAALQLEIPRLASPTSGAESVATATLAAATADRWLWAWLSDSWTAWRTALVILKPETVVAWHRQGFRLFSALKSRRRVGRPAVAADVRALIREDV